MKLLTLCIRFCGRRVKVTSFLFCFVFVSTKLNKIKHFQTEGESSGRYLTGRPIKGPERIEVVAGVGSVLLPNLVTLDPCGTLLCLIRGNSDVFCGLTKRIRVII